MTWEDVVPADVAEEQRRWERMVLATRARRAGLTLKQVGERLGVTREQARQRLAKAQREFARRRSPVEIYLTSASDIYRLAGIVPNEPIRTE